MRNQISTCSETGTWACEIIKLVPRTGKRAPRRCQARETIQPVPKRDTIQPVPNAGNHTTSAKRGEPYNQCQTRETRQTVPSAGNHTTNAKRGKPYNQCQTRETIQPAVPNAGKRCMPASHIFPCKKKKTWISKFYISFSLQYNSTKLQILF